MAIEEPAFEVLRETEGIEIRRYGSFIVAETLVQEASSREAASNEGFRRLFRYISGDNRAREKIEMTARAAHHGCAALLGALDGCQYRQAPAEAAEQAGTVGGPPAG
jgi:hypothetical protein